MKRTTIVSLSCALIAGASAAVLTQPREATAMFTEWKCDPLHPYGGGCTEGIGGCHLGVYVSPGPGGCSPNAPGSTDCCADDAGETQWHLDGES